MTKLWFSIYDFSFDYKGSESSFIDDTSFEWYKEFQEHYKSIYDELKQYLSDHQLEGYFNTSMVSKPKSWKTISLKNWGINLFKNQNKFPFTTSILNKYPEILSLSFNLLEPKSAILPHCGDTNGIYRCHLGLDIPEGLPNCGFRVREEIKAWENGKWLIFMDAYNHEAFNHSEFPRFIMVIDVLRDEYASQKNKIIATVRTSLFLQKRAQTLKFLLKLPTFVVKSIAFILSPFALIATKIFNLLKVY